MTRFAFEPASRSVLVRLDRPTGEWVLTRREGDAGAVYEIVQNGKLLMDTVERASEEALATIGLARCAATGRLRVAVGGLGFGFTLAAVLRDPRVGAVDVIELEPALPSLLALAALRGELQTADLGDPRVTLEIEDVRVWLARADGTYDAVLLDVDNGPESLSAVGNGALYTEAGLVQLRRAVRPGGAVAIWSSEPSPGCLARMAAVFGDVSEARIAVRRGSHELEYRVFSSVRR